MRKRQPTEEQKRAATERRERFRDLSRRVTALSDEERAELVARVGAVLTCEGRTLSLHNTLLLLSQRPGMSMVGGFRPWKAAGRRVRKGETGLGIWIPTSKAGEGEELSAAEGGGGKGEGEQRRRFVLGWVFDVGQTDADDGAQTPADREEVSTA